MSRIPMAVWIFAAALAGGIAPAETVYRRDGVVFEGALRKVVAQAGVCNVRELDHSPDESERLKGNQGPPLDLWQVDFAVRNESDRPLVYLRASGWVRSEHPPCTSWSGVGPAGGPLRPDPDLPISTVWSHHRQLLLMPYGMRPGQQERRAIYLVALHESPPRFGEWESTTALRAEPQPTRARPCRAGVRPDGRASRPSRLRCLRRSGWI